jgi:hypothetical protein
VADDATPQSLAQRLISRLVPDPWASSLEAESRSWVVRCPSCGFERSIWEMGGIRWKASGSKRVWARCPSCGRRGWQIVERRVMGDG